MLTIIFATEAHGNTRKNKFSGRKREKGVRALYVLVQAVSSRHELPLATAAHGKTRGNKFSGRKGPVPLRVFQWQDS